MRISLELVPRSIDSLTDAYTIGQSFAAVTDYNFPDLSRFSLRSWDACSILGEASKESGGDIKGMASARRGLIPHIRSIDFSLDTPFPHIQALRAAGVKTVLVITGDPPQDMKRRVYPTDAVSLIKKLKREMPELEILAAFDPYRTNIRNELDYVREKEAAGAVGFMSQPFFDARLLQIYAEQLEGKTVFWGISPVLTSSNHDYWATRNRAIFPRDFRPNLEWNIAFGRGVLDFCDANGFNFYLMPIKVDLRTYLSGLFNNADMNKR